MIIDSMSTAIDFGQHLRNVLQRTILVEPNPETGLLAEQELERLEEENPGLFLRSLLEITLDNALDPSLRCLSVICAKKAVPRRWSQHIRHRVADTDRILVHQLLWQAVGAVPEPVLRSLYALVALIARYDYPKTWGAFDGELLAWCSADAPLSLQVRWLRLVNHVWKQLAQQRGSGHRKQLSVLAQSLFGRLYDLWFRLWQQEAEKRLSLIPWENSGSGWILPTDDGCWLASTRETQKALRRIVSYCVFPSLELEKLSLLLTHMDQLERSLVPVRSTEALQMRYWIIKMRYMCLVHRQSLQGIAPEYILRWARAACEDLIHGEDVDPTGTDEIARLTLRRYLCQMRFLRESLAEIRDAVAIPDLEQECLAACENPTADTSAQDQYLAMWLELAAFLKRLQSTLMNILVERFLRLRDPELWTWLSEPETAAIDDEDNEWEDEELRPMAEQLCIAFAELDPSGFVSTLTASMEQGQAKGDWLGMEAAYRALGRAVVTVADTVDAHTLTVAALHPLLLHEAQTAAQQMLQARAAIFSGQLAPLLTRPDRCVLYAALVGLLCPPSSAGALLISLGAVRALRMLLSELDFYEEDFAPHLPWALAGVFNLMENGIHQAESFARTLDLLVLAIERCPGAIADLDTSVVAGESWSHRLQKALERSFFDAPDDGDGNLVRCQIVAQLNRLLTADEHGRFGRQPSVIHLALRMITLGTDRASPAATYLVDDALELFHRVLLTVSSYDAALENLFPRVLDWLEANELLRIVLGLLRSYIHLGGAIWYARYGPAVAARLTSLYGLGLQDRAIMDVADLLPLLYRCARDPHEFRADFGPLLVQFEHDLATGQVGRSARASLVVALAAIGSDQMLVDDRLTRCFLDAATVVFCTEHRALLAVQLGRFACSESGRNREYHERIRRLLIEVRQELCDEMNERMQRAALKASPSLSGTMSWTETESNESLQNELNHLLERLDA
jgi:hypothetical protein